MPNPTTRVSHTPGPQGIHPTPWRVRDEGFVGFVEDAEGHTLAETTYRSVATLLAAAPALLEAATSVVDRCEFNFRELGMKGPDKKIMGETWYDAYHILKSAIRAATREDR